MVLWAIIAGYVAQRIIEGLFIKRFDGMHIHVWRPVDSRFRLITARRNPNMVILVAALLVEQARRRARARRLVDASSASSSTPCGWRRRASRRRADRPIVSWLDA